MQPWADASARGHRAPAESLFIASALSQYLGASLAISLFDRLEPQAVVWLRVTSAAIVLGIVVRPWRRRFSRAELRVAALFGLTTAAMNLLIYFAIDHIDLGTAVAIEFMGPITVAVLGSRTARNLGALTLATGGVMLLAGVTPSGSIVGVFLALGAAAFWALHIITGARVAHRGASLEGLTIGLACGAIALAPIGLPASGPAFGSPSLLALAIIVGLASSAIPYGIDQFSLSRISRDRFAMLQSLLPVTAALVGLIVLGQVLAPAEVAGIGLVVGAVLLRTRDATLTP